MSVGSHLTRACEDFFTQTSSTDNTTTVCMAFLHDGHLDLPERRLAARAVGAVARAVGAVAGAHAGGGGASGRLAGAGAGGGGANGGLVLPLIPPENATAGAAKDVRSGAGRHPGGFSAGTTHRRPAPRPRPLAGSASPPRGAPPRRVSPRRCSAPRSRHRTLFPANGVMFQNRSPAGARRRHGAGRAQATIDSSEFTAPPHIHKRNG